MNTQYVVKNLGSAKRQLLEKDKQWLGKLLAEVEAKEQQLKSFQRELLEARNRRKRYDGEAATNENAAVKFAGAEHQLRKLEPLVASLEKTLPRDLQTMSQQIATIREQDIFKSVNQELYDQMAAALTAAVKPFFAPSVLDSVVANLLPETYAFGEVFRALWPPPKVIESVPDARQAVNEVITQIDAILAGDTVVEVGEAKDPAPPPEKPKPVRKSILSEEEVKRLRAQGEEILSRWKPGAAANEILNQAGVVM